MFSRCLLGLLNLSPNTPHVQGPGLLAAARWLLEVAVEPANHFAYVVRAILDASESGAVSASRNAEELDFDSRFLEGPFHEFRLLKGDGIVGVAVEQQEGRIVGRYVVDGRGFRVALDFIGLRVRSGRQAQAQEGCHGGGRRIVA